MTDSMEAFLKSHPRLPSSFVLDNPYLTGTDTKQRLCGEYSGLVLEVLQSELDSGKSFNAAKFQSDICRPCKKAAAKLWLAQTCLHVQVCVCVVCVCLSVSVNTSCKQDLGNVDPQCEDEVWIIGKGQCVLQQGGREPPYSRRPEQHLCNVRR